MLVGKAPKSISINSNIYSLIHHGPICIRLEGRIQSMHIHLSHYRIQSCYLIGFNHVLDYTWYQGYVGHVHLQGTSINRNAIHNNLRDQVEELLTFVRKWFYPIFVEMQLRSLVCCSRNTEGIVDVGRTEYL